MSDGFTLAKGIFGNQAGQMLQNEKIQNFGVFKITNMSLYGEGEKTAVIVTGIEII
jgi:hypothetical protein